MKSDPHGKLEVENGILQRKKYLFILFVVILATFGVGTYQSYTQPDGSTVESQIKNGKRYISRNRAEDLPGTGIRELLVNQYLQR